MTKYKIEFFLNDGQVSSSEQDIDLSLSELDGNVADSLANSLFITAGESENEIISIRCSTVTKYRVSVVDKD